MSPGDEGMGCVQNEGWGGDGDGGVDYACIALSIREAYTIALFDVFVIG